MEEQIQIETKKTPIYKRKSIIIPAVLIAMALVAYAAVTYNSVAVNVNVNEALSTTNITCDVAALPGESVVCQADITNLASVNLNTSLNWLETTNPNGVTYTTDMPKVEVIPAGGTVTVNGTLTIDTGSPIGNFSGNINLVRT